jgi:rhodanese-related sulfurtransferase/polyisoprenoid-binding protein YceI
MKSNSYKSLLPGELHRWMAEKKNFVLVDTLPADHFQRVRLPDAVNACVFQVDFIDQFKAISEDKDCEIVLYGSSGGSMDAIKAAEKLQDAGYREVNVLMGGIEAWNSAGLTLEGEAVAEPDDPQTLLKLEDQSYMIDTEQSTIQWTGRNAYSSHFGNIKIFKGELSVKGGNITGTLDIDMESMTNTNLEGDELQPVLISHLKSDDFFLTRLFPTATYKIIDAVPTKEPFATLPNYEIKGLLELRGVDARQDFLATVSQSPEKMLLIEAHFDIDRTRWNIIYGSSRFFEHLGMHQVFDLISIEMRIVTL